MKTVAVGDIHGCYNELLTLVDHIRKQTAGEDLKWVFVGDYIDRGPASREVIEYLKTKADSDHMET
jgi:serine/threonine protein phosphatase 1